MRRLLFLILACLLVMPPTLDAQLSRKAHSQVDILRQRADALAKLGRKAEAVEAYRELIRSQPRNTSHYYRLANYLRDQDGAEILLETLDEMLTFQPGDLRLLAERGRLLYVLERREEAHAQWQELVSRFGQSRNTYTVVATSQMQVGALDDALALLLAGRERLGEPLSFALDLARVYTAQQNMAAATREYINHLGQHPRMEQYITRQLIQLSEDEGALATMEPVILEALGDDGSGKSLTTVLSQLYFNHRAYTQAANLLLEHAADLESQFLLNSAADLAGENAWEAAGRVYFHLANSQQDARVRTDALLGLADSYEKQLVRPEPYESLGGYFPGNRFLELDIIPTREETASLQRALTLYDSLQTLLPRSTQAYQAVLRIAEMQLTILDDFDRAIQGFDLVMRQAPGKPQRLQAGVRLVDSWLARGDTVQAQEKLDQLIAITNMDKDEPLLVYSQAKIYLHSGNLPALRRELVNLSGASLPKDPLFNDALEILALIEGNGGPEDASLAAYFAAERLVGQHKLSEGVKRLLEIQNGKISDEAHVRAIELLLVLEADADAEAAMQVFLERFPDSPWRAQVLTWMGELNAFRKGDPRGAIPYYEEIIVEHPGYLHVQDVRFRLRTLLGEGS